MYPYDSSNSSSKSEDPAPAVQMTSELEHAQLELLSATCAAHQLRLHYSPADLARFARRDGLRKSAEAAGMLYEFYSALEKTIPQSQSMSAPATEPASGLTAEPAFQPTAELIASAIQLVCQYLRQQREHYLLAARPIENQIKARMWPYFSAELLDQIRIVELHGQRVPTPPFYADARARGFDSLPELTHMDSLTFLDIVVFNQAPTDRSMFHALVHAVQFHVLGVERYTELFVRSFIRTRTHFTVPLEAQAFALASKFMRPAPERFSVEERVRQWLSDGRY
jgi:hypothetical protein